MNNDFNFLSAVFGIYAIVLIINAFRDMYLIDKINFNELTIEARNKGDTSEEMNEPTQYAEYEKEGFNGNDFKQVNYKEEMNENTLVFTSDVVYNKNK